MSEQERPDVVLADPRCLQALRRALEERAVLTYCTDGATFRAASLCRFRTPSDG